MLTDKENQLLEEIERLRQKLNRLGQYRTLSDSDIKNLSNQIDELVVQFMRSRKKDGAKNDSS